jgi:hypothetical protein
MMKHMRILFILGAAVLLTASLASEGDAQNNGASMRDPYPPTAAEMKDKNFVAYWDSVCKNWRDVLTDEKNPNFGQMLDITGKDAKGNFACSWKSAQSTLGNSDIKVPAWVEKLPATGNKVPGSPVPPPKP